MNKWEKFLKEKGHTKAEFAELDASKMAELTSEYQSKQLAEINEAVESKATPEKVSELIKEALKGLPNVENTEAFKQLKETLREQGEELEAIKSKGGVDQVHKTIKSAVKADLLKAKDKLEKMKTDSSAKVKIELKAVAAMTFATHVTGDVARTEREAGIVDPLRRATTLLDVLNVSNTNAGIYQWVEKSGYEGGVEMVAEGAVKPQGDWDLTLYDQKPKKMALIVTVSKEMLDDIDGMAQDVESEILEQIRIFAEDVIVDGDGTGNNIVGFDANATPFVAGAFANEVSAANEFDALRVGINQVELNNDFPTRIVMHPTDAAKMELVKDATTSQYVMPPFASINGTTIKGLPITASLAITQGEAYVGNFNRFRVKMRENVTLDMGYRGAAGDWEKNMVSFLGEQRMFAFIPAAHYGSIVKIDFDVAKALLDPNVADA